MFRNSNVRKEDIVNALMEKYYVSELTMCPEPVDIIHGNERYQAIIMLSQPDEKMARKLAIQFVKSLTGIMVSERKLFDTGLNYAYCGRTQFEMTLYRCSGGQERSLPESSCEKIRNNEALAKAFHVFCEACKRGLEEGDPEYALFMLDKTKFWEE